MSTLTKSPAPDRPVYGQLADLSIALRDARMPGAQRATLPDLARAIVADRAAWRDRALAAERRLAAMGAAPAAPFVLTPLGRQAVERRA